MSDLPRPGVEPVSLALAGRLLTTGPLGKTLSPLDKLWRKAQDSFTSLSHPPTLPQTSTQQVARNEIRTFLLRVKRYIPLAVVVPFYCLLVCFFFVLIETCGWWLVVSGFPGPHCRVAVQLSSSRNQRGRSPSGSWWHQWGSQLGHWRIVAQCWGTGGQRWNLCLCLSRKTGNGTCPSQRPAFSGRSSTFPTPGRWTPQGRERSRPGLQRCHPHSRSTPCRSAPGD